MVEVGKGRLHAGDLRIDIAFHEDQLALLHVLGSYFRRLTPAGDPEPGRLLFSTLTLARNLVDGD